MSIAFPSMQCSSDGWLSRRDFIFGAAAIAGGMAMFSVPGRALAIEKDQTVANPVHADMTFTDSLGRSFSFEKSVNSVVPIGIHAQTLMETLYPDALVSLAKGLSEDADDFADAGLASIVDLAETGTRKANFGKEIDFEQIAELSPDIILQAGIPRAGVTEEMDLIQSKIKIPCVFLDVSFGKLQEAYVALGELFGCEERAAALAGYIEDAQARATKAVADNKSGIRVFYGPRVAGKKVTTGLTVQIDVMLRLGLKPVIRPYNFDTRTVDFVLLIEENPDFIFLDDGSFLSEFFSCEGEVYDSWKDVNAIREGRFVVAPALMHSILGSAIFVQSIGALWMAYVAAPSRSERGIDISAEMTAFYHLFYGLNRDDNSMAQIAGIGSDNE